MADLYLDTTVIVEALLKTRKRRSAAVMQLADQKSIVSTYAFKEFKAGPLQYWVWLHNKLSTTRSLQSTYDAMHRNLRQYYRVAGSLEALQVGAEGSSPAPSGRKMTWAERDREDADRYSLALRRRILKGWSDRRRITNEVTGEVDCFLEASPYFDEATGLIENPGKRCDKASECGFARAYKAVPNSLILLLKAMKGLTRPEDNRRRAALHKLSNTPGRPFLDQECRHMGDAHFALTCPKTAEILTSNDKDHKILAGALGIRVKKFNLP